METMQINRDKLVSPMDLEIVPFGYKKKDNEFVYLGYIGGEVPVLLKSRTISEDEFEKMCE